MIRFKLGVAVLRLHKWQCFGEQSTMTSLPEVWLKAEQSDEKSQCLVFGFVKKETKKLLADESLYCNISDLIIWIIISYYQLTDEWDPPYTNGSYKIYNKDLLIKQVDNIGSVVLKHIVSKGIFRWRFKIENIVNWCTSGFVIGIINSDQDLVKVANGIFTRTSGSRICGKGFDVGLAQITDSCDDYGIKCKNGDIIEMELNMNELYNYVKYIINDKDYGEAFEVEPGNYRAAIYIFEARNELRIIP